MFLRFRITEFRDSFQLTDDLVNSCYGIMNKTSKINLYNCVIEFHYREDNCKENQVLITINTCSHHYLNLKTMFLHVHVSNTAAQIFSKIHN